MQIFFKKSLWRRSLIVVTWLLRCVRITFMEVRAAYVALLMFLLYCWAGTPILPSSKSCRDQQDAHPIIGSERKVPNNIGEGRVLIVLYLMVDGVIDLGSCTINMRLLALLQIICRKPALAICSKIIIRPVKLFCLPVSLFRSTNLLYTQLQTHQFGGGILGG